MVLQTERGAPIEFANDDQLQRRIQQGHNGQVDNQYRVITLAAFVLSCARSIPPGHL